MKEKLYLKNDLAIINYTGDIPKSNAELMNSSVFHNFVHVYIDYLRDFDETLYRYALNHRSPREACFEICKLLRMLIVLKCEEIESDYLNDKGKLAQFIEELYNFWKHHQRFAVMENATSAMVMAADTTFSNQIRALYRLLEEKIQGRSTRVYRQLQAGTNACVSLKKIAPKLPELYAALHEIPFIDTVTLRTPLLIYPKSNKRTGMFTERDTNPIHEFSGNQEEWMCYPCKIGSLLAFIYLHRDYIASGISLANLFELATVEECGKKPDLICLFGNEDGKNQTTFYHDVQHDIWVGCVSYGPLIDYFGYIKKMSLTLHNLAMMQKGWLPIHGAFVNITLRSGLKKGIMLMGDSGAGKSESIEALRALGKEKIRKIEVVFDDMGSIHVEDGIPYGQGTEIGAFIRLDDLDKGTPYRDMDRSIFMNPDSANARVITPAAPYDVVAQNHRIDLFCYANNYDDQIGMREIEDLEEAKAIYKEGKRMALGTTQEIGISKTYFANPFGPMQKQEICDPLIDEVFAVLKQNHVYIGEIFTHLGFRDDNTDGLKKAAEELLRFIEAD